MSQKSEINWKLLGSISLSLVVLFMGIIIFKGRAVRIGLPIMLFVAVGLLGYGVLVAIGWVKPKVDRDPETSTVIPPDLGDSSELEDTLDG